MKAVVQTAAHIRCAESGSFSSWDSSSNYAWAMAMNGTAPDGAPIDLPF